MFSTFAPNIPQTPHLFSEHPPPPPKRAKIATIAHVRLPAWINAINKACNVLDLQYDRARQTYLSKPSGKLPVKLDEPDSSFVLAELVREVYGLHGSRLPSRNREPQTEVDLITFLDVCVPSKYKVECGMYNPALYRPGDEEEDGKIIGAACHFVEFRRGPQGSKLKAQSVRKELTFGNRIEQAMLKMEKWVDTWLSGAIPNDDLGWESFEFCLCMPDILEEGEVVE